MTSATPYHCRFQPETNFRAYHQYSCSTALDLFQPQPIPLIMIHARQLQHEISLPQTSQQKRPCTQSLVSTKPTSQSNCNKRTRRRTQVENADPTEVLQRQRDHTSEFSFDHCDVVRESSMCGIGLKNGGDCRNSSCQDDMPHEEESCDGAQQNRREARGGEIAIKFNLL